MFIIHRMVHHRGPYYDHHHEKEPLIRPTIACKMAQTWNRECLAATPRAWNEAWWPRLRWSSSIVTRVGAGKNKIVPVLLFTFHVLILKQVALFSTSFVLVIHRAVLRTCILLIRNRSRIWKMPGSRSKLNFDTDPDQGKNDMDPDPGKKEFCTRKIPVLTFLLKTHLPCIVCLYYLTINFP